MMRRRMPSLTATLVLALGAAAGLSPDPAAAAPPDGAAKANKSQPGGDKPPGTDATKGKKTKKGDFDIPLELQTFTLDNGLRVHVVEDHSTPSFAMHIAYGVGSRDEVKGRSGFAHLFEHMMFKGSKNVPDGGHFKHVLGVGGNMNAFTTSDVTQYFDEVPSNYLDMALWLEADRMRSLEITDKNFENQRAAVKEEKGMRVDNQPYIQFVFEFVSEVWKGTGYEHPTIGSLADLDAAQTKDVQEFFDKWYVPNNAVMAIVGDVDFAEVQEKVKKYFGDIPKGTDRPQFPKIEHAQAQPIERKYEDPLARQPIYLIGWKTVPAWHEDAQSIDVLMSILLRGESSRITRILKDQKKLVLGSFPIGGFGGGHDAGMAAAAFIPVEGASFDEIKKVVKEEVDKVKKKGIPAKELQKAINQVTVDTIGSMATNNGRAAMIAQNALFFDDPKYVLTELEKYRQVSTKDVKRVAEQYLSDNWLVLEIVPKNK